MVAESGGWIPDRDDDGHDHDRDDDDVDDDYGERDGEEDTFIIAIVNLVL